MWGSQSLLPVSNKGGVPLWLMNSSGFGGADTVSRIITGCLVAGSPLPWLVLLLVQNHESLQEETKLFNS